MSAHRPAPRRARIALVSAISLGLAAVPLALGVPAQAASNACSVTPQKPVYSHDNANGVKVLNYKIKVYCARARVLEIYQQRWEDDDWPNDDDHLGTTYWTNQHFAAGESYVYNNYRTLVDGEVGNEEMYQLVNFREGVDGLWSSWSGWMKSGTLSISN
jgi:hypothetical protein